MRLFYMTFIANQMLRGHPSYRTVFAIFFTCFMFLSADLSASPRYETVQNLQKAAKSFLLRKFDKSDTEITFGRLDPRLRLAKCDAPLNPYWPGNTNPRTNMVVGIRCTGTHPWKVYLPAKIKRFMNVLVSASPLPRGHRLEESDLVYEKRDVHRIRDYVSDHSRLVGKILKRSLAAGTAFGVTMVSRPRLIARGDDVWIVSRSGPMLITVKGKAMMDGRKGEKIRVRNTRSKRIVQAIVTEAGRVQVSM